MSIEIKKFTVLQIRNWLNHNQAPKELTKEVIRPAFAWAIIHNPYVLDDDPIVAALFDSGELAAVTCAFPEIFDKPSFLSEDNKQKRVWWFPMLWCKPQFRGKHYGTQVLSSLAEVYGWENSWTAWAVPASCRIFEHHGHITRYFPRYFMGAKKIQMSSIIGKLAYVKQAVQIRWHKLLKPRLPHFDYSLRYLSNVDQLSYDFVCANREGNCFYKKIEKLNWDLQFPWSISSPLTSQVIKEGELFSEIVAMVQNHFVQVWSNRELIGVYILHFSSPGLSCDNIFYKPDCAEIVYASVVEHIQYYRATLFDTEDKQLAEFVSKYLYFPKCYVENLSITTPSIVDLPEEIKR